MSEQFSFHRQVETFALVLFIYLILSGTVVATEDSFSCYGFQGTSKG